MSNNISLFMQDVMSVASPEFKEAWYLQEEIAQMRKQLSEKEAHLTELMQNLAGAADEIFAVANLKPYRLVNAQYIKSTLPDVYNKLVKVSDTNTGKILHASYTREQVNQYLKEQNPKLFEELASISVTDLEKEIGKTKTRELEGTGVTTEMRVVSKTQIVLKHPEKYEMLPVGKNEEDD